MESSANRQKGITALIALAFVFAAQGLFIRYLNTGFSITQQVYLRIFAAFLIGLLIYRKDIDFKKISKITSREWMILIGRALAIYVLGIPLLAQAIVLTKYSNVSFINALPLAGFLGFLIIKEKFTWQKTLFLFIAMLGAMMIGVKDYSHLFVWGKGEFLSLISAISFSFGYILTRLHSNILNNKEISILMFLIGSSILCIVSLILGNGLPLTTWTGGLFIVIFITGIINVINLFLVNFGFKHVEATLASNILTLESVFVVVLASIFYKEIPTLKELFGGVVILGSVIIMNQLEKKNNSS